MGTISQTVLLKLNTPRAGPLFYNFILSSLQTSARAKSSSDNSPSFFDFNRLFSSSVEALAESVDWPVSAQSDEHYFRERQVF